MTAPAARALPARLGSLLPRDPRILVAFQLTVNTVAGQVFLGFFQSWQAALTAMGTALAAEAGLAWLTGRRRPSLISAYISGVSIGILINSPLLWPYAIGSLLSIGSKYLVHYRGRHFLNPSNFGVVALLLLRPGAVSVTGSQWTNLIWIMLAVAFLGFMVMWRIGRLDVILAFIATFALMAGVRTALAGEPLAFTLGPLLGAALQLFVFFMITDPRTSPRTRRGRIVYGAIVAVLDGLLRMGRVLYAPFYALIIVCLAWGLLEPVLRRRVTATRVAGESAS